MWINAAASSPALLHVSPFSCPPTRLIAVKCKKTKLSSYLTSCCGFPKPTVSTPHSSTQHIPPFISGLTPTSPVSLPTTPVWPWHFRNTKCVGLLQMQLLLPWPGTPLPTFFPGQLTLMMWFSPCKSFLRPSPLDNLPPLSVFFLYLVPTAITTCIMFF